MMEIRSRKDYRAGYELLSICTEAIKTGNISNPDATTQIDRLKRELRRWGNKSSETDVGMGFMVERRAIKDYGIDGYIELVSIPKVFDIVEEANEFFKDFLEIKRPNTIYDCTGASFTGWYKLFKRRGQFWAYHRVVVDA